MLRFKPTLLNKNYQFKADSKLIIVDNFSKEKHDTARPVDNAINKLDINKYIDFVEADEFIVTDDLRERKTLMEQKSDAFIALPGGIGTLDEIAEILTLIQLKQISKPLVLINYRNYYAPLIKLFDSFVEQKLAKEKFLKSFYPDFCFLVHLL